MTWYVFDDSEDNYTMILDHNTTATQQWYSTNKNVSYSSSLVKPEVDKLTKKASEGGSGWESTLNPRLIKAEEITTITGNVNFDLSKEGYYCLESNKPEITVGQWCGLPSTNKFRWIYNYLDYLDGDGGYWTQTSVGSIGEGLYMWAVCKVDCFKRMSATTSYTGVRPVITISKSIIK